MRRETLLDNIGNISDAHILEFSDLPKKKTFPLRQWGILAACFTLMLTALVAGLTKLAANTGITPPENTPPNPPGDVAISDSDNSDNLILMPQTPPLPTIVVNINEIAEPNRMTAMINLSGDDFIPMTYDELLAYFDATLPIEETFPYLSRVQPASDYDYGIYETTDRGIYYDGNHISFVNKANAVSIHITLAKAFLHTSDPFDLSGHELQFTEVNGRKLAVFHYTNAAGDSCYSFEFMQNNTAHFVVAENVSQEDLGKLLQVLVIENESAATSDTHSLSGTIIAIDSYANTIGIKLDEGQEYNSVSVNLPEGEAAKYSLHEQVTVSYTGEPATVCCLWEQQLIGIKCK